jgi:hypothetical protein
MAISLLTCSRASAGYIDDLDGAWTYVPANTLRRSNKGVLIEESRTNSIRNNSMEGVAAGLVGSGGALPTNWNLSGADTGLTTSVVSVGTEKGVDYIDIRWQGVTNGNSKNIFFEASSVIAALTGQTWTGSVFFAIIGGSTTNVTSLAFRVWEYNNASALGFGNTSVLAATTALTRYTHTRTFDQATTNFTRLGITVGFSVGVSVDITLRIGWPQLEQGAFATSPIRTTGTAATRNSDAVNLALGDWFNPDEGTLFVEYVAPTGVTAVQFPSIVALRQSAANSSQNSIEIYVTTTTMTSTFLVRVGNVTQASLTRVSAVTGGNTYKAAAAYKANDFAVSFDGASAQTDTSGSLVTGLDIMNIGLNGSQSLNSYIKRIKYFPMRLSNRQLQVLTQ